MNLRRAIAVMSMVFLAAGMAAAQDFYEQAVARADDLRLSAYATVGSVRAWAESPEARVEARRVLRGMGVTKVYMEGYRSGTLIATDDLRKVREVFETQGFEVAGGIATLPGDGFGVADNLGLNWFNYQAPESQAAVERVVRTLAPAFDELIVDDFWCTGDTTEISAQARRGRSWSAYRRDLLTGLAQRLIVKPARQENPDIHLIIKFPQWYDKFHRFGYDVVRAPQLFDEVWIGTEVRGPDTQRYGFVPPYEGFANYRWITSITGDKTGGAWFDHGDCDGEDFASQAWQSVLAGAPELVLFNYGNLAQDHPGHAALRRDFTHLADLAAAVAQHPVVGPAAYKPPHSDPGHDLYLFEQLGMLGISLVPRAAFPAGARAMFLPTQAAHDPGIVEKLTAALDAGADVTVTTGFLAALENDDIVWRLAGLAGPVEAGHVRAAQVIGGAGAVDVKHGLDLAARMEADSAAVLLEAVVDGARVPFLTCHASHEWSLAVLNVHTFSEADFEAKNEVLLAPRQLGLLELPRHWANTLRQVMSPGFGYGLDAPARVMCQQLDGAGWVLQNHRPEPAELRLNTRQDRPLLDVFAGAEVPVEEGVADLRIEPDARLWVRIQGN